MQAGDAITIVHDGRTLAGRVVMISDNQVSALIGFDGLVGRHAGMMPVMRWNAQRKIYRSIIDGTEVTIREATAT